LRLIEFSFSFLENFMKRKKALRASFYWTYIFTLLFFILRTLSSSYTH